MVFCLVIKMLQEQSETAKRDARPASLIVEVPEHTLVPDSQLSLAVQKECVRGGFPNPTQRVFRANPPFFVQSYFDVRLSQGGRPLAGTPYGGIKALPRIRMIIFIEEYNT